MFFATVWAFTVFTTRRTLARYAALLSTGFLLSASLRSIARRCFRSQFQKRASDRAALISRFQQQVRTLGGEPQTDGGTMGTLHRALTEFSSLFRDDKKAALEAIDDGEEHLADSIKDRLEKSGIQGQSRALLEEAYASAREGEAFADSLT